MGRKYLDNYYTQLSAPLLTGETTWTLDADPPALAVGDFYLLQLARFTTVNGRLTLTKVEYVELADDGTLTRGAESSTDQDWEAGDYVQLVATASSFSDIDPANYLLRDGGTLIEYSETVGAGTTALDPAAGTFKPYTMTANTTFTDALTEGQNITVHLSGGDTWVATWPTNTLVDDPPVGSPANAIWIFWKVGGTLFRRYGGSY